MNQLNITLPILTLTKEDFLQWELPQDTMACIRHMSPEARWHMFSCYISTHNGAAILYEILDMTPVPAFGPAVLARIAEPMAAHYASTVDDPAFQAAHRAGMEERARAENYRVELEILRTAASASAHQVVTQAAGVVSDLLAGGRQSDDTIIARLTAKLGRAPTSLEVERKKRDLAKQREYSNRSYANGNAKKQRVTARAAVAGGAVIPQNTLVTTAETLTAPEIPAETAAAPEIPAETAAAPEIPAETATEIPQVQWTQWTLTEVTEIHTEAETVTEPLASAAPEIPGAVQTPEPAAQPKRVIKMSKK